MRCHKRQLGAVLWLVTLAAAACAAAAADKAPAAAKPAAPAPKAAAAAASSQPAAAAAPAPAAAASSDGPNRYKVAYSSVYGGMVCYADAAVRPSSTAELAAAIKQLRGGGGASGGDGDQRRPVKMRVSRSHFHGTASFGCPGAYSGGRGSPLGFFSPYGKSNGNSINKSSAKPSTVAILMDNMKAVAVTDRASYTATAQAGLRVDELLKWAEANGLSMERGAPSTYAELSIGGVLATSGHGTGHNVTSNLADAVIEFTWVDAAGNIHVSARHSPEGRALSGGIGLLGVITEVNLQMTPPSRTAAVSRVFLDDKQLVNDIGATLELSPWAAFIWRPDLHKYSAFSLEPTDKPDMGAYNGLVPSAPRVLYQAVELFTWPWQADFNDNLAAKLLNPLNCLGQAATVVLQTWGATVGIPTPVAIGSTNRIVGGGCGDGCAWQGNLAVDDIAFSIEKADLPRWIEDVRRITRLDLQDDGRAPDRCMGNGHYLIRFGRKSDDYAAMWGGLREPAIVELSLLRDRGQPNVPAKYSWVQEVVEQLTLCKYRGRPHWGKNFDRTYAHPDCPIADNLNDWPGLWALARKHDPDGAFTPPLAERVNARTAPPRYPGCALSKECYCVQDSDCGGADPGAWQCAPSAAFPEYRACRPKALRPSLFGR